MVARRTPAPVLHHPHFFPVAKGFPAWHRRNQAGLVAGKTRRRQRPGSPQGIGRSPAQPRRNPGGNSGLPRPERGRQEGESNQPAGLPGRSDDRRGNRVQPPRRDRGQRGRQTPASHQRVLLLQRGLVDARRQTRLLRHRWRYADPSRPRPRKHRLGDECRWLRQTAPTGRKRPAVLQPAALSRRQGTGFSQQPRRRHRVRTVGLPEPGRWNGFDAGCL